MTEVPQDRGTLMFPEQAKTAFAFLVSEWGFQLVHECETLVRYESDSVYIQVYHGRISFEIDMELGLIRTGNAAPYQLSAIIEACEPAVANRYRVPAVDDRAAVGRALREMARLLREYGHLAAIGDPATFQRLEAIVQARIDALTTESVVYQVRPKAEAAFAKGDYENAEKLYASISSSLSPVELKKLEIARKKLGIEP